MQYGQVLKEMAGQGISKVMGSRMRMVSIRGFSSREIALFVETIEMIEFGKCFNQVLACDATCCCNLAQYFYARGNELFHVQ